MRCTLRAGLARRQDSAFRPVSIQRCTRARHRFAGNHQGNPAVLGSPLRCVVVRTGLVLPVPHGRQTLRRDTGSRQQFDNGTGPRGGQLPVTGVAKIADGLVVRMSLHLNRVVILGQQTGHFRENIPSLATELGAARLKQNTVSQLDLQPVFIGIHFQQVIANQIGKTLADTFRQFSQLTQALFARKAPGFAQHWVFGISAIVAPNIDSTG